MVFGQNRAEYRNWGNDITGLQTNRIYCHINGLKTQLILITNFEHVLMVKPLIYEINKKTLLNIARQSRHMIRNLSLRVPLNAQLK